ncbi:MAG: substrate-binding periplasmic protein [Cellvibrionaceae bacterium]
MIDPPVPFSAIHKARSSQQYLTVCACLQALILGLILFAALVPSSNANSSQTFVHGAVQQAGFMDFESDGEISGFKHALVGELARRLNWQDAHQKCPFQRCLFSMANGSLDMMVFVSATQERFDYLDFIQVWPSTRKIPFYVRDGEQKRLTRYDDLSGLRIGVVNGYAYFPRFDKDNSLKKITVTTERQLTHMLQANRIDTYIAFDAIHFDQHSERKKVVKAPFEKTVESSALIAISKKSPLENILPQIEREIISMIDDGSLMDLWSRSFPHKQFPYPLQAYPKHTLDRPSSNAHSLEQRLRNVSGKK